MSKPESIKVEPWSDFPRQSYSLITDDFVHDKPLVVKLNAKGEKSTANIKATVSSDKESLKISDQIKIWFNLPAGRSLYSKIKSSNYLKVHYDHGIIEHSGQKWNPYATINANKSLQNISLRLGVAHISDKCHSDNRLKIEYGAENKKSLTWYNRTVVTHDKFTYGLVGVYGISQQLLSKNNLFFGYKVDDKTSVFLRAETDDFRKSPIAWNNWKSYFDTIKLDVISSYQSNIKYGFEAILSTHDKPLRELLAVVQHYHSEQKVTSKLRLSSNLNASVLVKFPSLLFTDLASTSIGVHGNDLGSQKRSLKLGAQVQFNI